MKGTAGSHGLDESCAALERIEAHLERLLEAAPPDPAPIWADVEQSLQRAREVTEKPIAADTYREDLGGRD